MTFDETKGAPSPASPLPSGWRLLGPVLAFIFGAVAVVSVTVGVAAVEIDRMAIAGSQRLADSAVRMLRREIALWAKDYAFWDAAVEHLVVAPNPQWAAGNVGQYAFDTFAITATLVVDPADRVLYFAHDGKRPVPPPGFPDAAITALGPHIAEARATSFREPDGVAGFVNLDGTLLLAGVAAITPQVPTEAQLRPHSRPVLIFIRELDDGLLADLRLRFNLPGLRLALDPTAASTHALAIEGAAGDPIGWIDWTPEAPASALFARVAPVLALVTLAMLALGWLALRGVVQVHHDLHAQAAALRRANDLLSANSAQVNSALQRAEHATRAKSAFLAGISHELRTPLTAIIGFSQILKLQHRAGQAKTREQEYAEIIHDSSQHLLNLVNDILDLSRIESGGYELEESWVDLGREARAMKALLANDADRRGVALEFDLPSPMPALYADAKGIRQIVINLLSNSLKFTDRGGWTKLAIRLQDDGLTLEVVDNGIGIAPTDQRDIWEPFTRARNPRLAKAEGTGLGLHLVKILADLHHAEVGLESALGQGTRVWVHFGPERVREMVD